MLDVVMVQRAAHDMGPVAVASRLGFHVNARSNRGACPVHGGKYPQSFALDARGGFIVAACHSCGFGGDVIELVGAIHGLTDFGAKLEKTAEMLCVYRDDDRQMDPADRAKSDAAYLAAQVQPELDRQK